MSNRFFWKTNCEYIWIAFKMSIDVMQCIVAIGFGCPSIRLVGFLIVFVKIIFYTKLHSGILYKTNWFSKKITSIVFLLLQIFLEYKKYSKKFVLWKWLFYIHKNVKIKSCSLYHLAPLLLEQFQIYLITWLSGNVFLFT